VLGIVGGGIVQFASDRGRRQHVRLEDKTWFIVLLVSDC
jgi:hypothetical protein